MDTVIPRRRPSLTLALVAVLGAAAVLRLWRLGQNGFANEYYSAGVRSMSQSWHNFAYNSFDPAGFISVDKPPVALWIQVASVKLFGFHPLGVLTPQALEGVAAVALLYYLVQRSFGVVTGLLAALFLAVTPVSVAIDRSSNTDSCLVLVLLSAAWALMRGVETGRAAFLVLAMGLIGVGFNVKMLAAFVVLPTFALVYFLGAPRPSWRRLGDLAVAGLVLLVVSLSWVVAYDLTPPERRPYAGTSDRNSMLELVVGPYGMGRFVRAAEFRSAAIAPATAPAGRAAIQAAAGGTGAALEAGPRRGLARLFVGAPAGALRLADGQLAGQVGWLFPLVLAGIAIGAFQERSRRLSPRRLAVLLWLGWLLAYGVVYSYAGGFFHFYYLATMAPPLAALAAIGLVGSCELFVRGGRRALFLPACLALTAAWQLYLDASAMGWRLGEPHPLHVALVAGTLASVSALALIVALRRFGADEMRPAVQAAAAGAVTIGLAAVLVVPSAWASSSVLVAGAGAIPSADLARVVPIVPGLPPERARSAEPYDPSGLVAFLEANRRGERFLLATTTTRLAAPIIIGSGHAVMAMGGFHGLDPILTPDRLAQVVEAGHVRFVMVGDASFISRRLGADAAARPIAEWAQENGQLVDPSLWRAGALGGRRSGLRLYDLRPVPLVAASP